MRPPSWGPAPNRSFSREMPWASIRSAHRGRMPVGPKWFKSIDWGPKIPNVLWNIPFMDPIATSLMKKTISNCGVASIAELRELCQEAECKFLACQMTVELFGHDPKGFIDGCEFVGAATYFEESADATQSLFI